MCTQSSNVMDSRSNGVEATSVDPADLVLGRNHIGAKPGLRGSTRCCILQAHLVDTPCLRVLRLYCDGILMAEQDKARKKSDKEL
ncbi:hypothetical protein PoB_004621400 [Plakobranchus ocellatus]|uniref:Uncharacterized protein n=1 Tax=Plakobranchus ocellatus TaxID=259542 RepID=A0AAV4BMZ2_9GAST|nr:hypothetical protein PoB_004621400 [Plakobranchus ocellatus]